MSPRKSEPNIWRFSDHNYRVTVANPEGGFWQEHFTRLDVARAWRDARLEMHRSACQPGAQKARKYTSAVQGFPVGTCPVTDTRHNKKTAPLGSITTFSQHCISIRATRSVFLLNMATIARSKKPSPSYWKSAKPLC